MLAWCQRKMCWSEKCKWLWVKVFAVAAVSMSTFLFCMVHVNGWDLILLHLDVAETLCAEKWSVCWYKHISFMSMSILWSNRVIICIWWVLLLFFAPTPVGSFLTPRNKFLASSVSWQMDGALELPCSLCVCVCFY